MPSNLDSIVPNRQCIGVGLEGHSEAILELFKWLKLSDNEKKCENMQKNCTSHEIFDLTTRSTIFGPLNAKKLYFFCILKV